MAFLEWLQGTWVGVLVAESLWGYPLLETIHSIGMLRAEEARIRMGAEVDVSAA
jgi:hypothetical protein